jgi:FkbM family methyltransferase
MSADSGNNAFMDLNAEIEKGLQHLHAGQLQKAEVIYKRLLQTHPNHSELLHMLGVISHQKSDGDKAAQLIYQAIQIHPTNPAYYCSLADLLIEKGLLDDAIAYYRKALELKPDFDVAHYNLGNTFAARGNAREAISCYQHALAVNPNLAEAHYNLAHVFHDLGKYDKALTHYRNTLRLKPNHVDTCFHLANLLLEHGNLAEAVSHYQKVLGLNPTHIDAHNNLGRVFNACGKYDQAIDCFQTAVDLEPEFAEGYFNLGLAFKNQGKIEAAIAYFQQALKLNPELAIAHHALGELLHDQGNYDAAICEYKKTLQIQPNFPETYYNLGNIAKDQRRLAEAISNFQKAIEFKPNFAEAYNNLGLSYNDQDQPNEAVDCYQKALQLKPDLVEAYYNLGIVHQIRGKYQAGLRFYEQALQINPDYSPAKWLYYLSLPILYDTEADIIAHRRRFADKLDTLISETKLASPEDKQHALKGVSSTTNFYLQYQGQNDLDLQKKYGSFVCRVMAANYPSWSTSIKRSKSGIGKKIHVGYVSSFMRNHTVGVYLMGWLENHDRSEFKISCYHIGNQTDALTKMFQQRCDHFYQIGGNIEAAAEQIIADDLDILVFTDIGMNAPATQLAALRLAPVQCKGWGHPVTTGLPTIDYYLSSDLMEPENAPNHYSEELVRLPNLALAYKRPNLPTHPKSRGELGIREDAFVYLISQSLFKLLPQHDAIYPRIAVEVPNAQFIFISHKNAEVTAKFKHRLARAFRAFELNLDDFCIFLPRLNHPDFLSLNLSSDVLLDTFSWSGGNTTLEGISCNLPVVTCPGEFMRGRHACAMLKMMGISETIAKDKADYIKVAVRLGRDRNFYLQCKRLIGKNRSKLFGDKSCIPALEDFYRQVARQKNTKRVIKHDRTFFVCGDEPLYHGIPFWDVVNKDLWERETFSCLRKYCHKENSYIDIGAWIGPTVLYGACVSKHVYAIEPDPVAVNQLKDNMVLNKNLKNKITLYEGCISDISGKIEISNSKSFGNSQTSILLNDHNEKLEAASLTFGDFVAKYNITDCNFIKMDVEGAEYLIIPTMVDFLIQHKPTLLVSIHTSFFKPPREEKLAAIDDTLTRIYKYFYLPNGDRISTMSELNRPIFDIVATDSKW